METKIQIDPRNFYSTYHGHDLDLLTILHDFMRNKGKNIIWLLGDSSFDNKHWLFNTEKTNLYDNAFTNAINGYEEIMNPPLVVQDVAYHVNNNLRGTNYVCINAAIEESTVSDRLNGH